MSPAIDEAALEAAVQAYDMHPALRYNEECNDVALRAAIRTYLATRIARLEQALTLITEMDGDQPARSAWDMVRIARSALQAAP